MSSARSLKDGSEYVFDDGPQPVTTSTYTIVWQDHYRFDVKRNGERYLSDCEPSFYGLVCTSFRGSTCERPLIRCDVNGCRCQHCGKPERVIMQNTTPETAKAQV